MKHASNSTSKINVNNWQVITLFYDNCIFLSFKMFAKSYKVSLVKIFIVIIKIPWTSHILK